jgi:hypothetical protein
MGLFCYHLTALRTKEDHPHGEVVGKILEAMIGPRSDEQEIPCLAWIALPVVKEDASAADDHVDLVLLVRGLYVGPDRKRELHAEGAPVQEADGMLSRRARDPQSGVGQSNHTTTT